MTLEERLKVREEQIRKFRAEGQKATQRLTELYCLQRIDMGKLLKREVKNGRTNKFSN